MRNVATTEAKEPAKTKRVNGSKFYFNKINKIKIKVKLFKKKKEMYSESTIPEQQIFNKTKHRVNKKQITVQSSEQTK